MHLFGNCHILVMDCTNLMHTLQIMNYSKY
uniref:Uncharacterized protein n=1 Tax=Anguilla anguilla TaxID=7936 RepID=A0A0E9XQ81_ANGAN